MVTTVLMPHDLYWSMDIQDLAEVSAELAAAYPDAPAPEVRQARLYRSFSQQMDATLAQAETRLYSETRTAR